MDDWYEEGCLALAVETFVKDPEAVLCAFGQLHVLDDGRVENRSEGRMIGSMTGRKYFLHQMHFKDCPAPSQAFFRRRALQSLSVLYDPAYVWCPELDLHLRLAQAFPDGHFIHRPESLVRRGVTGKQMSFRYPSHHILDTCVALERHLRTIQDRDMRRECAAAARAGVSSSFRSTLLLRDTAQLRRLAGSGAVQRWLLTDPRNGARVVWDVVSRGLRKLARIRDTA
jgi:hypothetical protein